MYKITVGLWCLGILLLLFGFFCIALPADKAYNSRFGCHVTMAYDQATFEGVREQVIILWRNMNETFGTENLENIYCTPWWWDQTYDNSLAAQRDYFAMLVKRIDNQIYESEQILAGNRTILMPYTQWYQEALDSLRAEMMREGGLDWALSGAWYLTFAPAAYWLWWYLVPIELILWILGLILLAK